MSENNFPHIFGWKTGGKKIEPHLFRRTLSSPSQPLEPHLFRSTPISFASPSVLLDEAQVPSLLLDPIFSLCAARRGPGTLISYAPLSLSL